MFDVGGEASVGRIPGRIPGTRGRNFRIIKKSDRLRSSVLFFVSRFCPESHHLILLMIGSFVGFRSSTRPTMAQRNAQ
jgi:hypothetical protein